jgi:hypothetical protein
MKHLLLFFVLTTTGCAPVYLIGQPEFNAIPKGSKKVVVHVPYQADSLLVNISKIMLQDGWPLEVDRSIRQITSVGKSVGGGTLMKPHVYVEQVGAESIAYLTGEWGADANGQIMIQAMSGMNVTGMQQIVFDRVATNKPDLAFQNLVVIGKKIPAAILTFEQ